MAAKILIVMPDGRKEHAHFPVDLEAWTFADGREFFEGIMAYAFPTKPLNPNFLFSLEKVPGRDEFVAAISFDNQELQIGPFSPSVEGLDGFCSHLKHRRIEQKNRPQ